MQKIYVEKLRLKKLNKGTKWVGVKLRAVNM